MSAVRGSSTATLVEFTKARRGAVPPTVAYEMAMRLELLRSLLTEHHAAGAMDGVLIGDPCPICAEFET